MRSTRLLKLLLQPKRYASTLNGLPFKITRDQASERLSNHKRFLEATNKINSSSALIPYTKDPIIVAFVPGHTGSFLHVESSYEGEYGIDSTDTTTDSKGNTTTTTRTDWYRCSGKLSATDYPIGTLETQVYAGFVYPRKVMEAAIKTHDIPKIQPITEAMLAFDKTKKIVYPHEMSMSYALEKLTARIHDLETTRAHNAIRRRHWADDTRVNTLDVHLSKADITLCSYHIPVYILETEVMGLKSYKIVNGYDGNIHGNKIYSIGQSTLFGASVGALLTWGITAMTRPYLLLPELLLRIGLGTSFSAMFSGALANARNSYNQYHFIHDKEEEAKANTQYVETEDDIARRKLAEAFNREFDYRMNSTLGIKLPADKCKLLGLNPEQEITLKMVKAAYYEKVKKWHPDLFREQHSKEIAEEMSKQINEANKELTDILQKKKSI